MFAFLGCLAFALAALSVPEASAAKAAYIGNAKCKACHIKAYKAWKKTAHAKAFASLKEAEAKDAKCLECHTTGFGKGGYAVGKDTLLIHVGCEACHGPGSLYKATEVMKDKAKAKEAGLVIPDAKFCESCHNKKSPTFKGFNFEKAKETGIHKQG